MTTNTITCTVLTASEGKIITNSDNTFFGRTIYLGANDSAENYHEISQAEYDEIVAAQNAEGGGQV